DPARLETFRTRIRSLRAGAPVPAGQTTLMRAQNIGGGMDMDPAPQTTPADAGEATMPLTGNPGLYVTPGPSDMDDAAASHDGEALPAAADTAGHESTDPENGPSAAAPDPGEARPDGNASGRKDDAMPPAGPAGGSTVEAAGERTGESTGFRTVEAAGEPAEGPDRQPAERRPVMGLIDIRVEPEADITIDGVYRTSGNQFGPEEIEPGLHRISCRQRDYEEYSETIRVIAGELSRRRITLRQMKGSLALLTDSGMRVFVDGKFMGITPLSSPVSLTTGKHLVELKKAGFKDWSNEVFIPSDETVNLRVSLIAL
ncbi:MAG TPA: PEGA domain-containing protein, partial [Candidatus Krumholzibacterium sp.]|nr:PEGA domain-containing protein [Candidatus Krumholzibacterium sp.]